MDISNIEQEYWDALERLKNGNTIVVDTKSTRFRFTKDSVGREAGRGKGYVRYERYPQLCDAIAEAEDKRVENSSKTNQQTSKLDREIRLKNEAREKYRQLKEDYDILAAEYINVTLRNLELETGLAETKEMKLKLIVNNRKLIE